MSRQLKTKEEKKEKNILAENEGFYISLKVFATTFYSLYCHTIILVPYGYKPRLEFA